MLCYQVANSEDTRINKYVEGLNYDIINRAMSAEWLEEPTLAGKMRRALDASRQLAALSRIPNRQSSNHAPTSHQAPQPPGFSRPSPVAPPPVYQHLNSTLKSPDAMDIDAISSRGPLTPEQCFKRVTPEARKKFVVQYRGAVPVQVSEVSFGPRPPGESITRLRSLFSVPSPYQAVPTNQQRSPLPLNPPTQLEIPQDSSDLDFSKFGFKEDQEEVEEVGVSTIQVWLDCSKAGRMLIPV
ncbi:uncharacterized protein PGTG_21932 [Puccinia graminis f. sp. tritici CRL 75-36-700-3]|uniref:Uncharacterized protein n=1 Tax=Puccinia graminis f. sp. tritici (strain CRL 75-36-700-3 / race SCCL) TaxID=418459 RepID=H6QT36_PUCGT|nr:uncharacterized protein PGTG_21932 [Puccinia graminis f. sp. tritici CRL 75-36-700-3]EHS64002.1 hypothetical protein PGTG_21932 [Puccinia graminis f. sp. tritici CRL 75-36-700-3]